MPINDHADHAPPKRTASEARHHATHPARRTFPARGRLHPLPILALIILITGLMATPWAAASDLVISRAVLEDPSGTLTIAQVAGRAFTPAGPILAKGYTKSAYWLRLRVRPPAHGDEVVLFIRQGMLNEVRLFEADPGTTAGWKTRVTGNHYPYDRRERAKNTLGFKVRVGAPEVTFFLRLHSTSPMQASVEALEPGEAERIDHQLDLLEVFFLTAMLSLLCWAIHSYTLDRLPVVGIFAIHQTMYTLFGVSVTGYLAPLIPVALPQLADLSSAIPYCAVSFTTLLFCRELFKPYDPPPILMRVLTLLLFAFPVQLAAIALGYTPFAGVVNAVLIKLSWWFFVVITFTLRRELSPSRRLLQFFFVTITLVFNAFWLVGSGPAGARNLLFGREVLVANGLLIGALFAMLMNARSRRLLLEAQHSAAALQAKSAFLALVSHEIRTPLNALVGFSSMARKATDPARLDQYLEILEQSSGSMMELVNGILDMSKIESGRMECETVPFNLRRLVADLESQYRPLAEQKGLTFKMAVAGEVPVWVLGDPVRLRQVLVNLLSNAVKFTDRGEVCCAVDPVGGTPVSPPQTIRFEVRDTGIGISDSQRPLLFEPFRQLDPSITRKFGGTGLGLAIVRSLTALMNGRIDFDSREGVGSTFRVELPLPGCAAADELPAPTALLSPATVLVIEDNRFNRRLLSELLSSWGQLVLLAEDGWQALQFMERQTFDLLLLDIRMPGIDGFEVARRVRRREQERSAARVPIIAITADSDTETCEACLAAGIDVVLAKPIIPDQLARAIAPFCGAFPPAPLPLQLDDRTRSDLGNDPRRALRYLELLQQDIEEELRTLHGTLDLPDRDRLGRAAHTLKGLCGQLADREPVELAGWLQENATTAHPEELRGAAARLLALCMGGLSREPTEENR